MSAYSEFFLNTRSDVREIEVIEIVHPDISHYRLCRNPMNGVSETVTHAGGPFVYQYCPMLIRALGSQTDLDQEMEITLGDVGLIVADEIANVEQGNSFLTKPVINYRSYRSDDLTAEILGPVSLTVDSISFNKQGAVLRARATQFNQSRTGQTYIIQSYPMLEPLA